MAQQKYDGVIEAVRYAPSGRIIVVRAYERRGPTFSDRVLINRDELVRRLQAGKRFFTGERQLLLASTFTLTSPVYLVEKDGQKFLAAAASAGAPEVAEASADCLAGVPLF
jgi:hypothetical protein